LSKSGWTATRESWVSAMLPVCPLREVGTTSVAGRAAADPQRLPPAVHGEVLEPVLARSESAHRAPRQEGHIALLQRRLAVLGGQDAAAAHHVDERVDLGAQVRRDAVPGREADQVGVQLALRLGDGPHRAAPRLLGLLAGV